MFKQKVVLPAGKVSPGFLIAALKQQAGVKCSYNAKQLPLTASIKIKTGTATVEEVLHLLQSAGIQYRILGEHVILQRARVGGTTGIAKVAGGSGNTLPAPNSRTDLPEQPANSHQPPARNQHRTAMPDFIQQQAIAGAAGDTSFHLTPVYVLSAPRIRVPVHLLHASDTAPLQPNRMLAPFSPGRKGKAAAFYAAAGLATDEIWRISPIVQAGMPWLYAIGSWGANFKQHAWSYGVGTSLRLFDQWRLHLMITTGTLEKVYPYLSDSIKYNISVKGFLHRGMITFETQLNAKYSIRFGPVMNMLKTSYYRDGMPVAPGSAAGSGSSANTELYPLLTVPYTLSNSYSSSAFSNTKTWIGLQVGIFYRLQH